MKCFRRSNPWSWSFAVLTLAACEGDAAGLSAQRQSVTATCTAAGASAPAGAWVCPQPLTLACGATAPTLHVQDTLDPSCGGPLSADAISYDLRSPQAVRVRRTDGSVVCESQVSVIDAEAPVLTERVIQLWPPNHRMHPITVADCVGAYDACDPNTTAEFIWASSDEPVDDIGDGHHAPDIVFDGCQRVQVRSERQGPRDGRVYKLGVRAVDGAGNVSVGQCTVIVDHDQRGLPGADSGEAYRIELDGKNGAPLCNGAPADAAVPPPADGGTDAPDAAAPDAGFPIAV